MMRRTAILLAGLVTAAVSAARALLRDRSAQDSDEIDLAAVVATRRLRMRAQPFIGATILVVAGRVELDLRRVVPAPTGVEVSVLMFGGSLRVVIPPDWQLTTSVKRRAAFVVGPGASRTAGDDPTIVLEGSAWVSRIEVIERSAPVAVAS